MGASMSVEQQMATVNEQVTALREEFREHEEHDAERHDELVKLLTGRLLDQADKAQAADLEEKRAERDARIKAEEEERRARNDRRNKIIAGLVTIGTGLASAGGAWWWSHDPPPAPAAEQVQISAEPPGSAEP